MYILSLVSFLAIDHRRDGAVTKNVIIFSDSIPRGIRIHEFNSLVQKGYAKMKSFPGATSKELLHYMDPTLKDGIYNTAIIDVGVNDLLNNKNTNK